MSFKEFVKELNGERIEGELLKTIFISLITGALTLGVLYFIKLKNVADFIPKYGFFLFFDILSYALVIPAVRQVRAYREFACMSGMMIGMTIGMIAGFLPGFFVGATNGMFYGSVFGMIIGISLGIWTGKCCGIMGVMEGTMAGFMGGLMGAMTAIMMINDSLKAAGIVVFAVSAFIVFGLNYMIYFEMKENEKQLKEDNFITILLSFALTIITTWLVVYGPRSALFGG